MRMQITVYVLLLMLLQKVTCHEEQQNKNGTHGSAGVTAVPGVCAVIPCAFTDSGINNITKEQYKWYKCSDKDCKHSTEIKDEDFNRWQTDPSKNCSVIIDLISSNDAGFYQFRPQNKSQYPSIKVTIQEKPMILSPPLTDGRQATLNCSIPNPCPTAQPQITWKLGGNFTSLFNATTIVNLSNGDITSMLTFTPSFDLDGTVVQCVVKYGNTTTYTNWTLAVTRPNENIDRQNDQDSKAVVQENTPLQGAQCDDNTDNLLTIRTVFSFLAGSSSTAIIACAVLCCVCICQRCGTLKATDGNTNIKLETVKIQPSQEAVADNAGANEQTPLQKRRSEEARSNGSGGLEEEDTPGEDRNLGVHEAAGEETKEVDYACIDYSLIQKRQAEAQKPKSEDTEYAEIHIKKQAEGEGDELLQDGTDQSASRLEEGVESQEQEGEAEVEV
ncbi:sialic acid-binding Ig-like lectin 9 isoform X1 [Pygocentrus nattereri]|uniref:sialic acid-binding Ig-like lectin 9 isoform X1 n=1 Tax=Pygocentrus nattereri TaxID=42514 RepID=UPI001891B61F|nr:sialic acid-binding Ig-like lectin 9 isoform X1 [Pygocentrus nattereri]